MRRHCATPRPAQPRRCCWPPPRFRLRPAVATLPRRPASIIGASIAATPDRRHRQHSARMMAPPPPPPLAGIRCLRPWPTEHHSHHRHCTNEPRCRPRRRLRRRSPLAAPSRIRNRCRCHCRRPFVGVARCRRCADPLLVCKYIYIIYILNVYQECFVVVDLVIPCIN